MSQFTSFLKQNKTIRENTSFAASRSFKDEKGKVVDWIIKPLSTRENEEIRDSCMLNVSDQNNSGSSLYKLDFNKYKNKVLCACIVEPCLYNQELQDSYGVSSPDELIYEMLDDPGEYDRFVDFVFKFNGFGSQNDKIETAKNS